jgi:hypothetical protein
MTFHIAALWCFARGRPAAVDYEDVVSLQRAITYACWRSLGTRLVAGRSSADVVAKPMIRLVLDSGAWGQ